MSAERQIGLLARVRPENLRAESLAWGAALGRGERRPPVWRYAPPPALGALRRALERTARALEGRGELATLHVARAEELELEARLAEQVGSVEFERLARLRHPVRRGPESDRARELAVAWASAPAEPLAGPRVASDDARHPESLLNRLRAEVGRLRLPIRVEMQPRLQSRAACGDGVLFVGAGAALTVAEARRIVAHELYGHALPRFMARAHPLSLLQAGSARANDDEEGRALHIEERVGGLDATRRRELGCRHLAALWVAGGSDAHDAVERLRQFGCELTEAIAIYARAARGGGLCRELEYIPAWLRFARASREEAAVAAWLARGRLSLDAARVLCDEGVPMAAPGAPILDLSLASGRATGSGT